MRKLPSSDKEFEKLVRDCVAFKYKDYFALFGRNGQSQYGADVLSKNRSIVVQCKFYDVNRHKSYEELRDNATKDFYVALQAFPEMKQFVIATSLESDTNTHTHFFNIQETTKTKDKRDISIELLFWSEIEDLCEACETSLMTEEYAKQFESSLFLHKENPIVCLKNLFVLQKYIEVPAAEFNANNDLWNRIGQFVCGDNEHLLLIEGDAGSGKTGLIQSLCWHYRTQDEMARQVLNGRPLVVVRLRDIDSAVINERDGLLPAILDDLNIGKGKRLTERKTNLLRRFPRAVLVLDGFDELCMIAGITRYEYLLYKLWHEQLEDWRIIVTSRPNYIHGRIDIPHCILELQHFDEEKRIEWLTKYTSATGCNQKLNDVKKEYIRKQEMTQDTMVSAEGVYDTPLGLYLLACSNSDEEIINNPWALYHQIFSKEIIERDSYDSNIHAGALWKEAAYTLAEEIAYQMYLTGNTQLFLREEEIRILTDSLKESRELIEKHGNKWDAKELTKRNTGLCSYWKVREERGIVEFYHNNIRDFFLCEKIYDGICRIYSDECNENKLDNLVSFFSSCFKAEYIDPQVLRFLYYRALYCKENNLQNEFPAIEYKQPLFPSLFQKLASDGRVYSCLNEKLLIPTIKKIVSCAFNTYRTVWGAFRSKDDMFRIWNNVDVINDADILRCFAAGLIGRWYYLDYSPSSCRERSEMSLFSFSGALYLSGINLEFSDLVHVVLSHANLEKGKLRSAILRGAKLDGANLTSANLMRAYLNGANLNGANLDGAHMEEAHLEEAQLKSASMVNVQLQDTYMERANLVSAHLEGANLIRTHLERAVLTHAYMNNTYLDGSHLEGANLARTCLNNAILDRAYMNTAILEGAILKGAKLKDAFLVRAYMNNAILEKANLECAHMEEATLEGANLKGANLKGANLKGANLKGANLEGANLQGANLEGAYLEKATLYGTGLE